MRKFRLTCPLVSLKVLFLVECLRERSQLFCTNSGDLTKPKPGAGGGDRTDHSTVRAHRGSFFSGLGGGRSAPCSASCAHLVAARRHDAVELRPISQSDAYERDVSLALLSGLREGRS